ncbi:Pentatricopeptide repeat-containing protein [Thalictrum thalictroides]|uniref:Pentatricopeptide repeat-containing protein n=1 Tax=Thalictrum thalictroides TaxID=46969 RepID=A0A7J6WT56_THATH|nr:Pentatricopeptide repeat-containing protein [Thalictrum thalictroides]
MPQRDLVAWNAMLNSYSQAGFSQEALKLFTDMRISGLKPDHFSFTASLTAVADVGELQFGRKIHGLIVNLGYQSSLPVCNSLIDVYGKCLVPSSARSLFEEMDEKNERSWCSLLFAYVKIGDFKSGCRIFYNMPKKIEIAWNILMAGFSRCGEIELCIELLKQMKVSTFEPDQWTYVALMNACSEVLDSFHGRIVQACIVKSGWSSAVEVNNSILSYYAKLGCHEDAVKTFESITSPTQVSWNTMMDAHMKMGFIHKALVVFQRAPEKNMVSWTAMITGYMRNGHGEQALSLFVDMTRNLLRPDDFTLGAVLHACSNLAVLGQGKMAHCCVIHSGFHSYAYVGNGLVNMYAKCGDLYGSFRAFTDIGKKDLISWNAMLFGFGLHGWAPEALKVYDDMVASGVRPDKVTFIGLLMACSHSGLIERGQELFKSMVRAHGLTPEADHVACMVDLLGRGGLLKQASELIEEYSKTITTSSHEALLGACAVHGDLRLGRKVGEDLMLMEPDKEISYMMLSNLYCTNGQWKEAEKIRKAMNKQGMKKRPGCSWLEVSNKVIIFVAGYHSNPQIEQLCVLLNLLESEMRNPSLIGFKF